MGRLMAASHASLRDRFCVSCAELDELVSIASDVEGVYGARLTGGGFGGCVIVLASADVVPAIESAVHERYDGLYEADATVITARSADAVSVIEARR
jgi:galactokinase